MNPIDRAVQAIGTQAELARVLGVLPQHVNNWRQRGIPAARCPAIEAATGIRCEELRPDVNWTRDAAGVVTGHVVPAAVGQAAA